ncbi:hypothetical protein COCON_G00080610 [Conger conger]|uniref:Uncharacterized protein n=1 Tax=Conger conger TaxID=82655 RepID=A0A9Q1DPK9_CONCO|nr:hypothetical protein COCON_G00080610 [Conger conger]
MLGQEPGSTGPTQCKNQPQLGKPLANTETYVDTQISTCAPLPAPQCSAAKPQCPPICTINSPCGYNHRLTTSTIPVQSVLLIG